MYCFRECEAGSCRINVEDEDDQCQGYCRNRQQEQCQESLHIQATTCIYAYMHICVDWREWHSAAGMQIQSSQPGMYFEVSNSNKKQKEHVVQSITYGQRDEEKLMSCAWTEQVEDSHHVQYDEGESSLQGKNTYQS